MGCLQLGARREAQTGRSLREEGEEKRKQKFKLDILTATGKDV